MREKSKMIIVRPAIQQYELAPEMENSLHLPANILGGEIQMVDDD